VVAAAEKHLVGSKAKESFEVAWKELNREAQSKGKNTLSDWLDSAYHEKSVYLYFPRNTGAESIVPTHWSV
jgi:hypothetical protein